MQYTVTVKLVFDDEDDLNNMLTALERLDEEGYFPTGADVQVETQVVVAGV